MYYRSMTLSERSAYEATIREWFPNIELEWRLEVDYPGTQPGDVDSQDPIKWRFYRNGYVAEGTIIDQMIVYSEDEWGRFHTYDALQSRQIIKETIFSSNELMFPMQSEPPPAGLVSGKVTTSASVRRAGA